MDNLGILIQAILSLKDTTDSKNQIAKELPKLESQLQSDKNTRVKIVAGLDVGKSKNLIQSQLNTITNQAKAPTIKVNLDTSNFNSNNTQPVIKPILDRSAYKDIDSYIDAIAMKLSKTKIADFSTIFKNIKDGIGAGSPEVKSAVSELVNALKLTPENQQAITDSYKHLIDTIRNTIDSSKIVNDKNFEKNLADEIFRSVTSLKEVQAQAPQTANTVTNSMQQMQTQAKQTTSSVKKVGETFSRSEGIDNYTHKISLLTSQIEAYRAANTKAEKKYGNRFDSMLDELSSGNITKERLQEIQKEFQILKNEIKLTGVAGKTFFEKLNDQAAKFSSWMTLTGVISSLWRDIKKMVANVIELDNSLLELSKVSDLSATGLQKVTKEAYALGKEVGKTGTQVIDAITNFKRAGFDLQQSTSFAKDALILTNVAEGINDAGEAATALISIMKGYGDTTPEFAQKILDSINQVSNTQAINFDDLVDGSQRLSAVAKQAGASFEQMLGILTGTNEVLQNIEKTSSGEITIFTRLQGIQLPDEEDVMPIAKLQETISTATRGVANVVDQTTGELRNVYDILDDINKVWNTLDKNTQEGIAFAAAGTRQKNVFLSMMENWENVKKSTESAMNSAGSAIEENQKYLDSISGKLANLESNFQSLSQTVVNSDLIKFIVDSGATILNTLDNIISKFGTIPTLLGSIATVGAIKNVGEQQNTPVYAQPQHICA